MLGQQIIRAFSSNTVFAQQPHGKGSATFWFPFVHPQKSHQILNLTQVAQAFLGCC